MTIPLRDSSKCKFDILSLGECMVRLAPPGHGRIEFARMLEVDVGGGEFNVGYACTRLGLRGGFISKLPDNPVAHIILNHARAVGMDVSNVLLEKFDGIGRKGRVGLNFTEVGTGVRASVTMYDRGHSSISHMKPAEMDWKKIFSQDGARWLHTGGILASLSDDSAAVVKAACRAAREAGTVASYDLNFRGKLWTSEKAIATTKEIVPHLDVLIGNEEDFQKVLGFEVEGTSANFSELPVEAYKRMVERVVKAYPNIKAVGTTLREVKSGLINNWGGILWHDGRFYEARTFKGLEIEDRVGGGDGFSSGIAYGFLKGMEPQEIVDFGVAHGALIQTTRGDTSQVTLDEVMHVMKGGSARIQR
jgi:2-dehydro-3-deoxygluconokinase